MSSNIFPSFAAVGRYLNSEYVILSPAIVSLLAETIQNRIHSVFESHNSMRLLNYHGRHLRPVDYAISSRTGEVARILIFITSGYIVHSIKAEAGVFISGPTCSIYFVDHAVAEVSLEGHGDISGRLLSYHIGRILSLIVVAISHEVISSRGFKTFDHDLFSCGACVCHLASTFDLIAGIIDA